LIGFLFAGYQIFGPYIRSHPIHDNPQSGAKSSQAHDTQWDFTKPLGTAAALKTI
jgi:hypothetical protein